MLTRTENLDRQILNMQLIVLSSHFSFIPRVIIEFKFDYIYESLCALELKMNIYVKWRMKIMILFLVEYTVEPV